MAFLENYRNSKKAVTRVGIAQTVGSVQVILHVVDSTSVSHITLEL